MRKPTVVTEKRWAVTPRERPDAKVVVLPPEQSRSAALRTWPRSRYHHFVVSLSYTLPKEQRSGE